jgi:hypothetical protein
VSPSEGRFADAARIMGHVKVHRVHGKADSITISGVEVDQQEKMSFRTFEAQMETRTSAECCETFRSNLRFGRQFAIDFFPCPRLLIRFFAQDARYWPRGIHSCRIGYKTFSVVGPFESPQSCCICCIKARTFTQWSSNGIPLLLENCGAIKN